MLKHSALNLMLLTGTGIMSQSCMMSASDRMASEIEPQLQTLVDDLKTIRATSAPSDSLERASYQENKAILETAQPDFARRYHLELSAEYNRVIVRKKSKDLLATPVVAAFPY